jgi:DNA-binding CsgD family transcriptional regulator
MSLKDKITKLRIAGKTYSQIQTKLKCSRGTISFHLGNGVKEKQLKRQFTNRTRSITELKQLHGGNCSMCGYDRCFSALEFHHIDPNNKKLDIGNHKSSFIKMAKEAEKCIALC